MDFTVFSNGFYAKLKYKGGTSRTVHGKTVFSDCIFSPK